MTLSRTAPALALSIVLAACSGDDGRGSGDASASATVGLSTSTTAATGGESETQASSSGSGSESEGATTKASTSESSGTSSGTTDATTSSTTAVSVTETDSESGTTTDDTTTGGDPCEGRMGVFEFSYLWVANTDQGSISKINTKTLIEEGRYYADPNPPGASSSRTSVNIDGHFVVVSNRASYSVTKVAADVADCIDTNNDGMITTSQGKDDLLPWGSDECVLWNTPVNSYAYTGGPRGTAWAPGTLNPQTCKYEDQKVWVGWLDAPGHAIIGRFDGESGVQDATVPLDNWTSGISPYGAAADGFGNIWTINVYQELVKIDAETLEVVRYPSPGIAFYGMTVDGAGNVWFGPYQNQPVAMFDAMTETFHQIPGTTENHRGVAVDGEGMVWVASNNGGTNGCGLNQIDSKSMTQILFHTFEQCGTPVGVSVDVDGYIWMVDHSGWAYRIDPQTYEKVLVPIAGNHYTYSDMTGGGLVGAIKPG